MFTIVGGPRFEALLNDGILQFVHWEGFDSVWLESERAGAGHLATGKVNTGEPMGEIQRHFSPMPGGEAFAARLMSTIEKNVVSVDLADGRNFADVCNGIFVSPALRRKLGISDATPAGTIPRWAAHAALRVVHIARIGATCQRLQLVSMKLMTGAAQVANIAFSTLAEGVFAADPGTYTLTGQFGIVEENTFGNQPGLWGAIIRFRDRQTGNDFRREIFKNLRMNEGAEIVSAVDAALHRMLPAAVLTPARDEMSGLFLANGLRRPVAAVWSDTALLRTGPDIWRKRTKLRFEAYLRQHSLGPYGLCPCGSLEAVKFCCLAALAD